MGKRKSTRKPLVSKGERRNCVQGVKGVRRDRTELEKTMFKTKAWKSGKNPWLMVPGPSSNMRFIRVRANDEWGDPRKMQRGEA